MRRSTSNRTAGRLFDNPSIGGLSLGALDLYVRRQVRGTRPTIRSFSAAAAEVIVPRFEPTEQASRLDGLMTRTARDVAVNPSTRLPGTTEIEREIRRRMENGELFAVCYADLDHFKEYNDRYSYNDGDRVIYILSRILHDVVKGLLAGRGFVGHIGGDDFIFIIPFDAIPDVCGEVLEVFDTLIPYQY